MGEDIAKVNTKNILSVSLYRSSLSAHFFSQMIIGGKQQTVVYNILFLTLLLG